MDLFALNSPWHIVALGSLLAAAGLLAGSFIWGRYDTLRMGRMAKRPELLQSPLLIVLALALWRGGSAGSALAVAGGLVLAGMIFGFVGDLFMAGVTGQPDVALGMGAFSIGHVFYMLAFRQYALALGLIRIAPYAFAVILLWLFVIVYWVLQVRGSVEDSRLEIGGLVYGLILTGMAGIAVGLAIQQPAFWPLALGGLLFVVSDALIAARIFAGQRFRFMGDSIWTTYIIAQALIVTSSLAAAGLL